MAMPGWLPGTGVTVNDGVRPTTAPRWAAHSCTDTASSPVQFTMVAGTEAAPTIASNWSRMSSSWMGPYGLGSPRTGIGRPATRASRWNVDR